MNAGMTGLILKRASASRSSGEWNDDDFDVLADGAVVGRIMKVRAAPVDSLGCGLSLSDIMRTAPQRTATRRRARPPWPRSPGAGGGSRRLACSRWESTSAPAEKR